MREGSSVCMGSMCTAAAGPVVQCQWLWVCRRHWQSSGRHATELEHTFIMIKRLTAYCCWAPTP